MGDGKIRRRSVEYNLTEHCNLRCRGCGHASPLLPEKFAALAEFRTDLEALAGLFHSDELRIVGGEPLLQPQLLEFLREARRIGVADRIILYTNGVLLHQASAELWQSIDELYLSVYPGVRRRLDESECARLCRENGVKLTVYKPAHFEHITINKRIEDGRLVRRSSTTASSGRKPPATPRMTAASGPAMKHEQLNRVGLQRCTEEDNSAEIEHTRKSLLGEA
jgi:organic radical activating enzyme